MNIQEQKLIATEIISKLRAIDPYVILAGGAPRDWSMEEEASDLDFYLHMSGKTNSFREAQLKAAFGDIGCKWSKNGDWSTNDLYKTMKFLHSIWETDFKGIKIQIMNLCDESDTFKVVDAMSCSICKVWWTPERGIVKSPDFKLTAKTGFMFLSEDYHWEDPHPKKMADKFCRKGFHKARSKEQAINYLIDQV